MLDFDRLNTPPHHGDTLIEPEPRRLATALTQNASMLRRLDVTLAGSSLQTYRQTLRRKLTGDDAGLVVGTGHQPEFIHPGVWAKHVVAVRLASAVGGRAVNLIVDSDAPKEAALHVPGADDGCVQLTSLRVSSAPVGAPYEDHPAADGPALGAVRRAVAAAMAARFKSSLMPAFLDALEAAPAADWVEQFTHARRRVERSLGVEMTEHRVSAVWFGPLVAEMIAHAHRFAACYNAALADYRRQYRVRGHQRPIPDLVVEGPRCEVAAWAHAPSGRRHRLYAEHVAGRVRLFAGKEAVGECPADTIRSWERAKEWFADHAGLELRPRALSLMLWARLCLCDLFIHGIGGAKYDRITDRLIRCYFGVEPPAMGCVTATLLLDLPRTGATRDELRRAEHQLRDLRYNPQRHLKADGELAELAAQRAEAVAESDRLCKRAPGERTARRAAFERIRSASERMLAEHPEAEREYREQADRIRRALAMDDVANRRDYFFALYRRSDLELLLNRLPATDEFRV